jgi:hypothetical protein
MASTSDHDHGEANMLNSALSRWIKQGLRQGRCPLCWVAAKAEHEYLWYFFDEYSTQERGLATVRASRGFCRRHAGGLRRIEVDNTRSTLGIAETYEEVLDALVDDLEALRVGRELAAEPCPACAARDAELERHTGYLLTLLAEDERSIERFVASPGLCVAHFRRTWAAVSDPTVAELLRSTQSDSARMLRDQLTEHIRRQGAEARDEAPGEEVDAWQRAMWLCGGWPDPALDA